MDDNDNLEFGETWNDIRDCCLSYSHVASSKAFTDQLGWIRRGKQVEEILGYIPRGGKVLDLGCGWGHTTAMFSSARPDLEVTGVDLSEHPLWRQFATKYKCKFAIGNGLSLPFKEEVFDAVVSFGVIEHVAEGKKFLCAINRVLRAGGYNIVLDLPHKYSLSEFLAKLLGLPVHSKKYTVAEIRDSLAIAHFHIILLRKENLIPAQFYKLGRVAHVVSNKMSPVLDKMDSVVSRPLSALAQSIVVFAVPLKNAETCERRRNNDR